MVKFFRRFFNKCPECGATMNGVSCLRQGLLEYGGMVFKYTVSICSGCGFKIEKGKEF